MGVQLGLMRLLPLLMSLRFEFVEWSGPFEKPLKTVFCSLSAWQALGISGSP